MKKFKAEILASDRGGAYVVVPFDVEQEFGKKRPKIKATFDGVVYRGIITKYDTPYHILLIRKDIRTQIGKQAGDTVQVTLEADTEPRVIIVPDDFQNHLDTSPQAATFFKKLSYTHQKEYVQWITGAKRADTRTRRIQKAVEMLLQGKRGR